MRFGLAPLALTLSALCAAAPLQAQTPDPVPQAERLIQRGQHAEARRLLEPHARANPSDARGAMLLGRAHLEDGAHDPAIEWLERAVRLDERSAEARYLLGSAYGLKAQRTNVVNQARLAGKAKGALERAVALDPAHVMARFALAQYHTVAPRVMGGDREEAKRQAAQIKQRDPYRGALAFGMIHGAERNWGAAVAEFESALRQFPDSTTLVVGLGSAYDQQGRPAEALRIYEAYLKRRPGEPAILYQVGRIGAMTGQNLERSEEALRQYLLHRPARGQPPLAAAHWRLGMILERQGQPERARAEYRAALALDPKLKEAREALKKIGG